jgi:hypothetical protein
MADPATLLVQNVAALYGADPQAQKSADAFLRDWQTTDRVMPDSVEGLKKVGINVKFKNRILYTDGVEGLKKVGINLTFAAVKTADRVN